jgi:hypothetical protein
MSTEEYVSESPWFVERMKDMWGFALITSHGLTFLIENVSGVEFDATGEAWLRVELREPCSMGRDAKLPGKLVFATCDRKTASIRLASVVAAVEVFDT